MQAASQYLISPQDQADDATLPPLLEHALVNAQSPASGIASIGGHRKRRFKTRGDINN